MKAIVGVILPLLGGAVIGFVLTLIGVQQEFAWAWGILLAATIIVLRIRLPDDPRSDAPGRAMEREYVGSEVSRLAWSINLRGDSAGEAVTRRVRASLRRRLARRGIDPDDDAQAADVDAQLGPGLWQRLNGRGASVADIRAALAAAAHLASGHGSGTGRERAHEKEDAW